ncbi:MAG: amidohydrolase family protein [Acidimicrobiia bacterium]|nr:amidohydrolase family protein [Acidimicrobiia bacterium]
MEGARISYVGSTDGAPKAGSTTSVKTVMPGIWECHGHFLGLTNPDVLPGSLSNPIAERAARATRDMRTFLDTGITSVREPGGLGIDLRHAVDDGSVIGPSIYSAGQILSTTGGHADVHAYPLDFVTHHPSALGLICDGISECLKAVRTNLRRGAALIKICASGGVMSEIDHPIHQQFSAEELKAIVEEAGRAERSVAAHCHGKPGIMAAIEAGVKTIEHGSYLDEEAADAMVETDTILVPTRFVIAELLQMEDILPPHGYRKGVMVAEHHERAMKIAVAAGVKMATGTDIIMSGNLFKRATREISYLVEAGLPPIDAIEAATANGPDTLGAQAPLSGQLKEDYDADVIAIDFNPLEDWNKWGDPDRVTHVWKAGEAVKG